MDEVRVSSEWDVALCRRVCESVLALTPHEERDTDENRAWSLLYASVDIACVQYSTADLRRIARDLETGAWRARG